jgi:hypothetical protein
MSTSSAAGEGPAVVLRSHYVHVRGLLIATIVALAVALAAVVATGSDSSAPAPKPVAPAVSHVPLTGPAHDSHENACGYHYVGSILVAKQCGPAAERPN